MGQNIDQIWLTGIPVCDLFLRDESVNLVGKSQVDDLGLLLVWVLNQSKNEPYASFVHYISLTLRVPHKVKG